MEGLTQREMLSARVREIKPSGIRKFFDIAAAMPDIISLGVGEPDFVTPEHISQAGIAAIQSGMTHYTSNYGSIELREALSTHLKRRYGVTWNPKTEIMVTVGVSEAIDATLRAVIDPGDEVIIPDPGYVAYEADVTLACGVVVPVATRVEDEFEIKAAAIEAALTPRSKVILLGNPNNPTGAVIARAELEKIAELAQRHDLLVISDEVYSRLVYGEEHVSIAALPGMKERVALVDGFSKAYAMTGWRVGYVCADAHLLEAILKVHQYTIMCAPTMSQAAALQAITHGEADVLAMVASYNERRTLMVNGLNSIGLTCYEPRGAFYAFPSIAVTGMTSDEFAEKLLHEQEVAVVSGAAFGAAGEGFIRCTYCAAREKIEEAIERMGRFVQAHKR
jgi:aminotransferase